MLVLVILPLFVLLPTIVKGQKNIPRKGRMILVCNHQSNLDAVILGTKILKRKFNYMAKSELFKNKFTGSFFRGIGMYPINRQQNDIQAVKKTLSLLKKEKAICIFPEGTRIENTEMDNAKNGVALFALKTKSPIVPACILNKPKFFRINKLVIGEPFILSEMEEFKDKPVTKEILTSATQIITTKMKALKDKYTKKTTQ
jgi:1-acyl-sn-glycerol-3-phosphate acyltransferase